MIAWEGVLSFVVGMRDFSCYWVEKGLDDRYNSRSLGGFQIIFCVGSEMAVINSLLERRSFSDSGLGEVGVVCRI